MQLQMTTDYAIQTLIYLATKENVVTSSELSEHLNISQKSVYNICCRLKKANYVSTALGTFGGYSLNAAKDISLYDIVLLFEGGVKIDHSYSELQTQIEESLKSITLVTLQLKIN